jgi:hypothetical protein
MKPFIRNAIGMIVPILFIQQIAFAHAFLDHADPRVGSTVTKPPASMRIWFSDELDPATSTIQVFNADGKEVDAKDSHVDVQDKALMIVSLLPLSDGTYQVVWHVTAADTHKTAGDFRFTVKQKP